MYTIVLYEWQKFIVAYICHGCHVIILTEDAIYEGFKMIKHDMFPEDYYYITAEAKGIPEPGLTVLGNKAKPWTNHYYGMVKEAQKNEGNNPMYNSYTAAPTAAATIVTADPAQAQRDYLLDRARKVLRQLDNNLFTMFGRFKKDRPETAQQLIDAIKNGKYTLDEKKLKYLEAQSDLYEYDDIDECGYGPFYGIDFTDYPGFDSDGHSKAEKELEAAFTALKDIIAIKSGDDALTALQAFEKWEPSNKPATLQ